MNFFGTLCFLAFIGLQLHVAGAAVGTVCTAAGTECGTDKGFYCDSTAGTLTCKCAKIYTAAATSCTDITCTADATCTTLDLDSVCSSGKCACKPYFELTSTHFAGEKKCTAIKIGSKCTSGNCDAMAGAYCDSTTNKCACGALYTGADGVTSCTSLACTYASTDTTCSTKDSNSRCVALLCDCMAGYEVHGTSKLCQSAGSGVGGLVTSASLLVTGIVLTLFL